MREGPVSAHSIDLIVRDICCLRPGIEGVSGNIRVRSLVGRYLEHGRILFLSNGGAHDFPLPPAAEVAHKT